MPKGSYIWNGLHETRITAASKEKSSWNMLVLECIHFESDLLWNLLGFEAKHLKQSRTCEILFSAGSCCMLDFWTRNITRLKGKVLESDVSHRIHLPQWFYALCNLLMHYWNHMVIDFSNHVDWQLLKLTPQDTKFIPNWQVPNWQGWKFNAVFFSWEFLLYSHITN